MQVHNRTDYLRHLVSSLRKAVDIEQTLLVFSHDFYSDELNDIVASIDFCPVCSLFLYATLLTLYSAIMYRFQHGLQCTWCFIKRHPFSFFHNSVKWWSIYAKIFTRCSWRNTNSKYLDKMWLMVKYFWLVVMWCWCHNVSQVQTCLSQLVLSVATLLRWWT